VAAMLSMCGVPALLWLQVRGAYVVLERKHAQEKGMESPVFDNIEGTHNNYDECMKVCIARAMTMSA